MLILKFWIIPYAEITSVGTFAYILWVLLAKLGIYAQFYMLLLFPAFVF